MFPRSARARAAAPPTPRAGHPRRAPAQPREPRPVGPPAPAALWPGPHLPSFAFFLRARVPPSFPKKESSFFRDGGDLGVGDLGTDGDFCGEVAMAAERTAAGRSGRGAGAWADAAGLRLRLSKRKRNYSKHLRQLTLAFPFPLSLPRAALRPARSCALRAGAPPVPGAGKMPQISLMLDVRPYLFLCVRPSNLRAPEPGGCTSPGSKSSTVPRSNPGFRDC